MSIHVEWRFHPEYSAGRVRDYVPRDAGIYLLWVKLKNGNWRCFYVGQARNLEQRLLEHLSASESNTCVKTHVSKHQSGFEYAVLGREADRDGAEKFLYDYYDPECNQVDPGGTPLQVNVPS